MLWTLKPIEQPFRRLHTRLLMIGRPDAAVDHRGRRGLAQIVAECAEHDRDQSRTIEVVVQRPRLVDDHQRVRPDVAFRMPLGFLLAADEGVQLRQQRVR